MTIDDRLSAIRGSHEGWSLLTDRSDVKWASGFSGSSGWLLVGPVSAHLVTDARYTERAESEVGDRPIEVITTDASNDRFATTSRVCGVRRLGVRASAVTVLDASEFRRHDVDVIGVDIASLRRRKDDDEIELIRRAASIADRALQDVLPMIDVGVSELDVRDELDHRMRRLGADGPSYDTIVAAGPRNSAIPHHQPSPYRFAEGDPIVIDVGALLDGYHSDMTRTFVVGEPAPEWRHWYEAISVAQALGVAEIGVGISCRHVDEVVRESLGDLATWFLHGTGHGVGLDIHEEPFLNRSSPSILLDRDVVTVEPGLYRGGLGGIRIEDLVVVRPNSADVLTSFPKELLCLPSPRTT